MMEPHGSYYPFWLFKVAPDGICNVKENGVRVGGPVTHE